MSFERRSTDDLRHAADDVPDWAVEVMRAIGRLEERQSRTEGIGVGIMGILGLFVALLAAHIIVFA